jgi:mono/diheme cytochrome c family protein
MKTTVLLVSAICAGLVLTGLPGTLLAGSCHQSYAVSYAYPVVKQVTVVKEVPVYVAAFTPVVAVGYVAPAVYAPPALPAAMPQQSMPQDPCAQLKDRVANLERLLQQSQQPYPQQQPAYGQSQGAPPASAPSERVPAPSPVVPGQGATAPLSPPGPPAAGQPGQPQPGQGLTAAAVIVQRCAECHTAGRLKGGFALTGEDGRLLLMTPEQIRKVIQSTKGRPGSPPKMPKGKPPLNDEEFAALLDLVDQQ